MCQTSSLPYFSPIIRMKCWLFTFLQAQRKWIFSKWRDIFAAVLEATKMDIFDRTLGHFQVMLMATKPCIFDNTWGHFPAVLVATKPDISGEMSGRFFVCVCNNKNLGEMFRHFQAMLMTTKLHIFDRTLGHFQDAPGATTQEMFDEATWQFPAVFLATEPGMPKHDLSPKPNKWIFVPKTNQTLSTVLSKHKIENLT